MSETGWITTSQILMLTAPINSLLVSKAVVFHYIPFRRTWSLFRLGYSFIFICQFPWWMNWRWNPMALTPKRNNPQYRPSNTEGCYSLLVSSIIDLTSLSTDRISFLRYPGVTWSLNPLLFCNYMVLWKAADYKTEYVIKYYCNFCTTGRNHNFPASFCWRWYCAVLWW